MTKQLNMDGRDLVKFALIKMSGYYILATHHLNNMDAY